MARCRCREGLVQQDAWLFPLPIASTVYACLMKHIEMQKLWRIGHALVVAQKECVCARARLSVCTVAYTLPKCQLYWSHCWPWMGGSYAATWIPRINCGCLIDTSILHGKRSFLGVKKQPLLFFKYLKSNLLWEVLYVSWVKIYNCRIAHLAYLKIFLQSYFNLHINIT